MRKGYLHIYTGKGKGKTTAAIGLAIRAAGAGKKVLFAQFLKQARFSEHRILANLGKHITVRCFGSGRFLEDSPKPEDYHAARKGLDEVAVMMARNEFDLVILDEIIVALTMGLLKTGEVLDLIHERPMNVEMVLTGRNAPEILIDAADLVTEMAEVKHYFHHGIAARKGIEM